MSPEAISHPLIHELLSKRSSPNVFDSRAVSSENLIALFEAAPGLHLRAMSNLGDILWRLATNLTSLSECFRVSPRGICWAKLAPVLVIGCVRLHLSHGAGPYPTAEHDLGLASANLVFEATARGLGVHQMTRIDRDKIR